METADCEITHIAPFFLLVCAGEPLPVCTDHITVGVFGSGPKVHGFIMDLGQNTGPGKTCTYSVAPMEEQLTGQNDLIKPSVFNPGNLTSLS